MDYRQIQRLIFWNRLSIVLLITLSVGLIGVSWFNRYVEKELRALRVYWTEEGGIELRCASDGPFVVTHLSVVSRGEPEKSVARLSPPIVIIDSAGATLSKSDFEKLKWYGYLGDERPAPAADTAIVAFYSKPISTRPSTAQ
jgi:hypothetical protein